MPKEYMDTNSYFYNSRLTGQKQSIWMGVQLL